MNYRHAFHAGNFADVVKHAALLALLRAMTAGPPLTVVDVHGGAGAYDLGGEMARRSGEAAGGVLRLMDDPAPPDALRPLKQAVARFNGGGATRLYPGSPVLAAGALRREDRLVACELRPDDHALLVQALANHPRAEALLADGYRTATERAGKGPSLVLIDPPFERADDYDQAARTLEAVIARNPSAAVMVWLPLKDLETFDAFLRRLHTPVLVAETRLRALTDPMKMNGCALVVAGAPPGLAKVLEEACGWAAGADGSGRVWTQRP